MKMMKRKTLCFLLAAVLMVMMTACSSKSDSDSTNTNTQSTTSADTSASTENSVSAEPYEIYMTFMTLGMNHPDILKVQDAVNEITLKEINTKVKLIPMSIFERENQVQLMIFTGEKLDLMMSTFNSGIGGYVNQGQLLPLDDLLAQYGSGIEEALGLIIAGGYYDGNLYAIPTAAKSGVEAGLIMRKDIADKYGFTNTNATYQELDDLFAKVKAGEGDNFYMFSIGGSNLTTYDVFGIYDKLGASEAAGVLMDGGRRDTTIVNLYATPEYKEHCQWMRKWYEAGYISKDVVTYAGNNNDLMQSGNYLCWPTFIEVDQVPSAALINGFDMIGVSLGGLTATTDLYQTAMWTIPVTCKDPITTFKLLNLMYTNKELCNLLSFGIEGEHYVKTDDPGIIRYPDGIDANNVGYFAFMFYGNNATRHYMEPMDSGIFSELADFNASITDAVASRALGYTYNAKDMQTEFAAVNSVIAQYRASLESGAVDPDEVLPQFLSALQSSGIDKLIADNQQQLDNWLSQQN